MPSESNKGGRVCRMKFSVKAEERAVVARISTIDVDRDGDVMLPSGVDLTDFKKNPVVLFGHDHGTLPIGKAVGIRKESSGVLAKVEFAARPEQHPPEAEWVPDTILSLFKQRILRAFSIGFLIEDARPTDDKDRARFGTKARRIIAKWKLLEFSVVNIPANQNALATAVSKGLKLDPYVFDKWHLAEAVKVLTVPRPTVLRYTEESIPQRLRVG